MWPFRAPLSIYRRGENLAARHLRKAGYRILERNVPLGRYEIDIIARDHDTVVFVEVKTRRDNQLAEPEDNVGFTKQQHIRTAARLYQTQHDDPSVYYRFDVVSVLIPPKGKPEIKLFRNAFQD